MPRSKAATLKRSDCPVVEPTDRPVPIRRPGLIELVRPTDQRPVGSVHGDDHVGDRYRLERLLDPEPQETETRIEESVGREADERGPIGPRRRCVGVEERDQNPPLAVDREIERDLGVRIPVQSEVPVPRTESAVEGTSGTLPDQG